MLDEQYILAVVPARSGSRGIPHKNMCQLLGTSLIGWAGRCLSKLDWLDARLISTDSEAYAEEGRRFGLDAFFLRPAELSGDRAGAVETISHSLSEAERNYGKRFHVILIVEPTSPLRKPEDLEAATRKLIQSKADSVVTVSALSPKCHPAKILAIENEHLVFYESRGASIVARQSLERLYFRNGVCYAIRRSCLVDKKQIISDNTLPIIIEREVVNIDEPLELEWAERLMQRDSAYF